MKKETKKERNTNELIYKAVRDPQTQKTNLCREGEG